MQQQALKHATTASQLKHVSTGSLKKMTPESTPNVVVKHRNHIFQSFGESTVSPIFNFRFQKLCQPVARAMLFCLMQLSFIASLHCFGAFGCGKRPITWSVTQKNKCCDAVFCWNVFFLATSLLDHALKHFGARHSSQ